jgi:hypothetical protein
MTFQWKWRSTLISWISIPGYRSPDDMHCLSGKPQLSAAPVGPNEHAGTHTLFTPPTLPIASPLMISSLLRLKTG